MESLADNGNGNYAYVDDIDEAQKLFVEDLTSTLQMIALDAKIQVDFNPDVVAYCAEPVETVALIRDWGCAVVMGNCEDHRPVQRRPPRAAHLGRVRRALVLPARPAPLRVGLPPGPPLVRGRGRVPVHRRQRILTPHKRRYPPGITAVAARS